MRRWRSWDCPHSRIRRATQLCAFGGKQSGHSQVTLHIVHSHEQPRHAGFLHVPPWPGHAFSGPVSTHLGPPVAQGSMMRMLDALERADRADRHV